MKLNKLLVLCLGAALAIILNGCAVPIWLEASLDGGARTGSITSGIGGQAGAGAYLDKAAEISIHGLAGYHRFSWDDGHNNSVSLAAQGRYRFGTGEVRPWWAGVEVMWLHATDYYEEEFFREFSNGEFPTTNGFGLGVLGGYLIPAGAVDVNIFAALNLLHFGEYKVKNLVFDESTNGAQVRVGVEVQLPLTGR
jgi:hypothetical protein